MTQPPTAFESSTTQDPAIRPILECAVAGERLADADAERLFASHDLAAIGRAAHRVRLRLHPDPVVTFIIDRNINYTNVCLSRCAFCAFSRDAGDPDAWVIERVDLRRKIEETYVAGGRQILLQGGLHPDLPFHYYEDLLRWMKSEFPDLHVHGFSPTEIAFFSERFGMGLTETLERLRAAGLDSLPGGGAEILSDRLRSEISPRKVSADGWIEVMRAAHRLGLRSSATMVIGLGETAAERVEHLRRLRDLQDETGGFTAFIVWTFQPRNTRLGGPSVGAFEYLKTAAIARLYLDNILNLQASWVTMGEKIAQLSLAMGVNDLGSLMLEENVVAAAGTRHATSVERLRRLAEEMGYELRRRDFYYEPAA